MNSNISAFAMMEGNLDFNKKLMIPTGTKVAVHEKPNIRHKYGQDGVQGWYIGPAVDHCRCYKA